MFFWAKQGLELCLDMLAASVQKSVSAAGHAPYR